MNASVSAWLRVFGPCCAFLLLLSLQCSADGANLVHGLGVRRASEPESPAEIATDFYFVKLAVGQTTFERPLKQRIEKQAESARNAVQKIASKATKDQTPADAEEARRIWARFDKDIAGALTPAQMDELNRRTKVIFFETFLLADGIAGQFDELLQRAGDYPFRSAEQEAR